MDEQIRTEIEQTGTAIGYDVRIIDRVDPCRVEVLQVAFLDEAERIAQAHDDTHITVIVPFDLRRLA